MDLMDVLGKYKFRMIVIAKILLCIGAILYIMFYQHLHSMQFMRRIKLMLLVVPDLAYNKELSSYV